MTLLKQSRFFSSFKKPGLIESNFKQMKSQLEDECQNVMMCPLKVCSKKKHFSCYSPGYYQKIGGKNPFPNSPRHGH